MIAVRWLTLVWVARITQPEILCRISLEHSTAVDLVMNIHSPEWVEISKGAKSFVYE